MKTVYDVIAEYPDGWPSDEVACFTTADKWNGGDQYKGSLEFANLDGSTLEEEDGNLVLGEEAWVFVCTKEEYEKELAKRNLSSWYDYENQKPTNFPPNGCRCEVLHLGEWRGVYIVGMDHDGYCVYVTKWDEECPYEGDNSMNNFRPLDYDRYKKVAVDLSWLVDSGIDVEVSDGRDWYVAKLVTITDSEYRYRNSTNGGWKQCRPRQDHPLVLTKEQLMLIPTEGFNFIVKYADTNLVIVTFIGLADGYIYPWEE